MKNSGCADVQRQMNYFEGILKYLKNIAGITKKHEILVSYMNACMDFSILGKIDIRQQLISPYLRYKIEYNEHVYKNCHILRWKMQVFI